MEAIVKLVGSDVASADIRCEYWRLSCCHVWRKSDLVDDVVHNLQSRNIDLTVLEALNIDTKIFFYISIVFDV